jgi:hypothetical protein
MFSDLEHRAFVLGRRMAEAAFTMEDNPFAHLQPRLARRWLDGFVSENALHGKTGWLGHDGHHHPHADEGFLAQGDKPISTPETLVPRHLRA